MARARTNLHIFMSAIEAETRLYKETEYTLEQRLFERVVVCGTWEPGLARKETTSWGLEIERKPTLLRRFRKSWALRRLGPLRKVVALLSLIEYFLFVIWRAIWLRPTHVSCHNVFVLPLAWIAAKLGRSHLIYVPHELETLRTHLAGIAKKIQTWIERRFVHSARDIVVVCDPIAQWYRAAYNLDNVAVVRNLPWRKNTVVRASAGRGFRDIFDIPDTAIVFIYQGILGPGRGTYRLLEAFASLDSSRYHLVLMGFGDEETMEDVEQANKTQPNIHYQPAVPMEDIVTYTSSADLAIFITDSQSLSYQYALPNKFFEYMHGGLPVLLSDNLSYMAEIVHSNKLGWTAPYAHVEDTITQMTKDQIDSYRERTLDFAKSAVWENDAAAYSHVYRP